MRQRKRIEKTMESGRNEVPMERKRERKSRATEGKER